MKKYIIVEVREPDIEWPPYVDRDADGRWHIPTTNLARVRKAIHHVSRTEYVNLADMVTHTRFMTQEESETVQKIFEGALARAKRQAGRA